MKCWIWLCSLWVTSLHAQELQYWWDFGDGKYSTEVSPAHDYTEPGIYQVSMSVFREGKLKDTQTHEVDLVSPSIQSLAVKINKQDNLNLVVSLNAELQATQALPLNYRWRFGDGSEGEGSSVEHTYAAAGDYELVLESYWQTHKVAEAKTRVSFSQNKPIDSSDGKGGGSLLWLLLLGIFICAIKKPVI